MRHPITNRKRPWYRSPIVAVVLVAVVAWAVVAVVSAYTKHREAVRLRDQYAREYSELEAKRAELEAKIDNLSTTRGLETEVRSRYRVSKDGEQLVVVVDNDGDEDGEAADLNWWQKLRLFVGI